jgi:hypothetical protein
VDVPLLRGTSLAGQMEMAETIWTRICCSDCPTDLQEPSSRAHETGAEVARQFGAAFAIFHVAHGLPSLEAHQGVPLEIWEGEGGRLGRAELISYRGIATPFDALLLSARGADVDLLVLGTQRSSGAELARLAPREEEGVRRVLQRAPEVLPRG